MQQTGQQVIDAAGNIVLAPVEAIADGLGRGADWLTNKFGSTKGGAEGGAPGAYKGKGGQFISEMDDDARDAAPKTIKAQPKPAPAPAPKPVVAKAPVATSKNAYKTAGGKFTSDIDPVDPAPAPTQLTSSPIYAPPPPPVVFAPPPPAPEPVKASPNSYKGKGGKFNDELYAAKGGKVPSYSKLRSMLKGCK